MPKKPVRLIGLGDIAEACQVTAKVVRAWKMRGRLPVPDFQVGQSPAWKPDGAISEFLEKNRPA